MKKTSKVLLACALLGMTGCATPAEASKPESTVVEQKDNTPVFLTKSQVLEMLNENFSGMATFEYKDGTYVMYDESGAIETLMSYYIVCENLDQFSDEMEELLRSMIETCGIIDDATGTLNTIAIVNPVNTENILVMLSADGVFYNAFGE